MAVKSTPRVSAPTGQSKETPRPQVRQPVVPSSPPQAAAKPEPPLRSTGAEQSTDTLRREARHPVARSSSPPVAVKSTPRVSALTGQSKETPRPQVRQPVVPSSPPPAAAKPEPLLRSTGAEQSTDTLRREARHPVAPSSSPPAAVKSTPRVSTPTGQSKETPRPQVRQPVVHGSQPSVAVKPEPLVTSTVAEPNTETSRPEARQPAVSSSQHPGTVQPQPLVTPTLGEQHEEGWSQEVPRSVARRSGGTLFSSLVNTLRTHLPHRFRTETAASVESAEVPRGTEAARDRSEALEQAVVEEAPWAAEKLSPVAKGLSPVDVASLSEMTSPDAARSSSHVLRSEPTSQSVSAAWRNAGVTRLDSGAGKANRLPRRKFMAAAAVLLGAVILQGVISNSTPVEPGWSGTLLLETSPSGIEALIDGEPVGHTPLNLSVEPGAHLLELHHRGATRQIPLKIDPGAEVSHEVKWFEGRRMGHLEVATQPPGARVFIDGDMHGVTPLTVSNLPVGSHNLILHSSAGTVRKSVTIKADETTPLMEVIFSGWLAVFSRIPLQISSGGRLIGAAEDGRIMMPPGRYELELTNDRLGYQSTHVLDIEPGQVTPLNIGLPNGMVQIDVVPWGEVWIEGEWIGRTPLGDIVVPLGTREIRVAHPELGEQRRFVDVTLNERVQLTVDLTK